MKKISISIVIYSIIALLLSMQVAFAEDWPMFHHDLALNGVTSSNAPDTNNILWTYQTEGSVESSAAVVGDKLYIGSTDGSLYCIGKETGALIWKYPTGGPIQSSPAVSGGIVYFLSTDGNIYALNSGDGSLIWLKPIGTGPWDWSSPAIHDGKVFIGASNGFVHCMDATTGTIIWSSFVGGTPNSPITVANGKVYSGTHNFDNLSPTLAALDESTGMPVWTYSYTDSHPDSVAFINSNGVAVNDGDGDGDLEVYFGVVTWMGGEDQAIALDEATGKEVWTHNINGWSTSTPAVHNGKIFIGSDDGKLYSLNAADGSEAWTYPTGAAIWSAPAVSGDKKVCFGSLDHTVYCVSEETGDLIWSYFTGASRLMSSPAISTDILFIGNENGKVYAFGTPNIPPVCDEALASISEIWPPNHTMIPVSIEGVYDPDGGSVDITIDGITQDESVNEKGDGNTKPDGSGVGMSSAMLRSERSGKGNSRVYVLAFTATDNRGGICNGKVSVCVPHDMRPNHACIDDGQKYDSTKP